VHLNGQIFYLIVFTIGIRGFIDLQFRVLPRFKSADVILGLSALRELNVAIQPSSKKLNVRNNAVTCHREPRRKCRLLADSCKMGEMRIKKNI